MTFLPNSPVDPHSATSFEIRIDLIGCRLHLAGRLDRSTVHLLHDAISTLLLTDGQAWVVDATQVTACDLWGIRGIGTAYRRALRHHRQLRLTGTPPFLESQLTRLRLDHHLLDRDGAAPVPDSLSV
jgi:anti-anti-sigma regulatory factor